MTPSSLGTWAIPIEQWWDLPGDPSFDTCRGHLASRTFSEAQPQAGRVNLFYTMVQ